MTEEPEEDWGDYGWGTVADPWEDETASLIGKQKC